MGKIVVLVKDNGGEGEVVGVFQSFEDAFAAGEKLGANYSIYVREPKEET